MAEVSAGVESEKLKNKLLTEASKEFMPLVSHYVKQVMGVEEPVKNCQTESKTGHQSNLVRAMCSPHSRLISPT
jgi:hypothetical protein